MRTLHVSVAVLVMIVTAALAPVEAQQQIDQIDLGADLDNVFWLNNIMFPKLDVISLGGTYDASTNSWTWNKKGETIYFNIDELPAWTESIDKIYFVICVIGADFPYGQQYITLRITNDKIILYTYVTEPVTNAVPERCFTSQSISSSSSAKEVIASGYITIWLEGPTPFGTDAVSVKISKVGIAPPEGALNNSANDLAAEELAYISADTQGMLLLGLGAIMIAILAFVVGSRYR